MRARVYININNSTASPKSDNYGLIWKHFKIISESIAGYGNWAEKRLYLANGTQTTYVINTEYNCNDVYYISVDTTRYTVNISEYTSPVLYITFYN